MFKYPVAKEDKPMVNWELGQFDVLIIDELSMVPEKIFRHVARTFQYFLYNIGSGFSKVLIVPLEKYFGAPEALSSFLAHDQL